MPLVDVRGFQLDPQIGRGIGQGAQNIQRFQQIAQTTQQREREDQIRQALSGAQTPTFAPQTQQQQMLAEQSAGIGGGQALAEQPHPILSQEEKIQAAKTIDPAIANKQLKAMGLDDDSKLDSSSLLSSET